jgi:hypothetical protein
VRLRQRNSLNLGMDDQMLVTMETQKEAAASILQTFLLHCSKHRSLFFLVLHCAAQVTAL